MNNHASEVPFDTIVIGGGLAGIATSLRLADRGQRVALVEARRHLGGRVGSYWDASSQQWVDFCQHVGMRCCRELQWWIARLHQGNDWDAQSTLHFYGAAGKHIPASGWYLPAPLHLSGLLVRWPNLSWKEKWRIARGMLALMQLRDSQRNEWEELPALEWLQGHHQTPQTISQFWATILVSALGEQMNRVQLGPAHKVLIDGFLAERTAYHLLIPKRPLTELMGQSSESALLDSGVSVRKSCQGKVYWEEDRVVGVRLDDDCLLRSDRVVVAVPWHAVSRTFGNAPNIFQEEVSQRTASMESAPITGIHTWWDTAWLPSPHAILMDRFCHWVFPGPQSAERTSSEGHYYQVVISGSRHLPKGDSQSTIDQMQSDLNELFPSCRQSRLLRAKVVTDPNAVFSVAPGHQQARMRHDRFASQGLFLAGDWIATGWPATMESALLSSKLVATSILNS